MRNPSKIHIIGGPGSGKSHLARELSDALECPHIELDSLYWGARSFNIKASPEQRAQALDEVISLDAWVTEGAYCAEWIEPSLEAADAILLLDMDPRLQKIRLLRRLGARAYKGTFDLSESLNLLRWIDGFEESLDRFPKEHEHKLTRLVGRRGVDLYLKSMIEE